jgi:GH15 family glucan-1,4-alpha-glucosidase
MLHAGLSGEADAWGTWLLRAVAGDPAAVQIMYGIGGERRLDERELDWLPGYEGSRPVRVGNAASTQLQLDVYGELLDAVYQSSVQGVKPNANVWSLMRKLLEWLEDGWRLEDAGLWEVRGPSRHFTHSKVMAWVAFDRAVKFHDEVGASGPVERWRALRDEIHAEVLARAWSEAKGAFAQSYDSDDLDASVLMMPLVGFIDASDERMVATAEAIRRELTVDGLVMRYQPKADGGVDGIAEGEGVFLACTFWMVEVLALQGRHEKARELFERLLDLRNDVGLLSEEYDPVARRQLGNVPQAFSHLALVSAALVLGGRRAGLRRSEASE